MNYIENFGLEFLTETEDDTFKLFNAICTDGKAIFGYYNLPYMNCQYGRPQFIVRTCFNKEKNTLNISGFDTHAVGSCVWKVGISHQIKAAHQKDPLTRQVVTHDLNDGTGAVTLNLVNADVLPSFLPKDEITAQVVGFPLYIRYFENEDKYAEEQPALPNGNKMLLSDGMIFPTGLFSNAEEKNTEENGAVLIRGTVKKALKGTVQFGEEKDWTFLDVIINTQFGDLEIMHTVEQVQESDRKFIKEGAVVSGVFTLSADVAIFEYEKGIVRDFEHNLSLLRYTFQEGEAERLRAALSDDAEYISEWAGLNYYGKDEIINKFNYVMESNPDCPFFAHLATIISIDEGDEELPYSVGQRCIIIASESEYDYDSICFMECDEENKISKIVVSRNPRYHFKLDEKKEYPDLYDFKPPKDFYDGILARAHFHRFLDDEYERSDVESQSVRAEYYNQLSRFAVECFKGELSVDGSCENLPRIFAYLFVKAMELELYGEPDNKRHTIEGFDNRETFLMGYESKDDNEKTRELLNYSYDLGSQFYKDLSHYCGRLDVEGDCTDEIISSLVFVQQIGEIYAKNDLKNLLCE